MKTVMMLAAATVIVGSAMPALATSDAPTCGNAPESEWVGEDAAKAKGAELGYEIRNMKVEDGCYELYAIDKENNKLEVFLNPVTLEVVRVKN